MEEKHLTEEVHNKLLNIANGIIKKYGIIDEEEALAEVNFVIGMASRQYDPSKNDNFTAYACISIVKRLINFSKKNIKAQRNIEISLVTHKLEQPEDVTLRARWNAAIEKSNNTLTKRQNIIMNQIINGLSDEEIIMTHNISRPIFVRERRVIVERIKGLL